MATRTSRWSLASLSAEGSSQLARSRCGDLHLEDYPDCNLGQAATLNVVPKAIAAQTCNGPATSRYRSGRSIGARSNRFFLSTETE
jgi:hypothetical protein